MAKFISVIVCLIFVGCGYDRFSDYEFRVDPSDDPNTTIAQIREMYRDKPLVSDRNYVIHGYVSSSDRGGNFFKSFVIQDNTGSMEIMAGLYDLHSIYPLGSHVVVKMRGLTVAMRNSVLQIGIAAANGSGNQVDYIGYRPLLDSYVFSDRTKRLVEPRRVGLDELVPEAGGELVRIDDLTYADQAPTWGVVGSSQTSYRRFDDTQGRSIYVVCSGYSKFAAQTIPTGKLSATGILQYGTIKGNKSVYMIKIRDMYDIDLH